VVVVVVVVVVLLLLPVLLLSWFSLSRSAKASKSMFPAWSSTTTASRTPGDDRRGSGDVDDNGGAGNRNGNEKDEDDDEEDEEDEEDEGDERVEVEEDTGDAKAVLFCCSSVELWQSSIWMKITLLEISESPDANAKHEDRVVE